VKQEFVVIIPARFDSTRLPGKPLLQIGSKPLIQHVFEHAAASEAAAVYIATDSDQVKKTAEGFSASVVMTADTHHSGTERIAEACDLLGFTDDTLIVNVQGDEFDLLPQLINQVAANLAAHEEVAMATRCEAITTGHELADPNVVKVEMDERGYALYFSRAAAPFSPQESGSGETRGWRHIGIYAYRAGFIRAYCKLQPAIPELREKLEQLRAMFHGYKIHVAVAECECGIGVDTEADLERARQTCRN
jgi:3-deoxy-manno-octulosonate cytidylyltransferase (CMP-KDO synthetase)